MWGPLRWRCEWGVADAQKRSRKLGKRACLCLAFLSGAVTNCKHEVQCTLINGISKHRSILYVASLHKHTNMLKLYLTKKKKN